MTVDFPGCQGAARAKNGPKCHKFLSVASYVSGTIYHIILIFGIIRDGEVKGQKVAQNDRIFCLSHSVFTGFLNPTYPV